MVRMYHMMHLENYVLRPVDISQLLIRSDGSYGLIKSLDNAYEVAHEEDRVSSSLVLHKAIYGVDMSSVRARVYGESNTVGDEAFVS